MKKLTLLVTGLFLLNSLLVAQSVAINTDGSTANASAILDVKSNTKGILIPRTSTTSRNAIANPAMGLILYDTTTSGFWFYNGSAWNALSAGSSTNYWTLSGSNIYNNNSGNTGIGTTTPQGKLHIKGSADVSQLIIDANSTQSNTQPLIRLRNSAGTDLMHIHSDNPNNVFLGLYAGSVNNAAGNGIYNTFLGASAGRNNTTGSYNTASGSEALYQNTTGSYNTAFGAWTLRINQTAQHNTAIGYGSLFNDTTGNENTAIGYGALTANASGNYNTANGALALRYNTSGTENSSFGVYSLYNNINGGQNSATGKEALYSNTLGSANTANGYGALYNNFAGSEATAVGYHAMFYANDQTTPFINYNVAVGTEALRGSTTASNNIGNQNTALGYQTLFSSTSGSGNTANGYKALYSNTLGGNNIGIGSQALFSNTVGNGNIAIGNYSDVDLNNSSSNIVIGYSAHVSGSNSVAIGYGSFNNMNNVALLGNPSTAITGGYNNWFNFISDGRLKTGVNEDVKGLDFIMRLRPVTYHVDVRGLYNQWGISPYGKNDSLMTPERKAHIDESIRKKESIRMSGFIAQEVEKAAQETGYDFDGIKKPQHDKDNYGLAYSTFVVPLVKAVQEQQKIIEKQQKQIDDLAKELQAIKDKLK